MSKPRRSANKISRTRKIHNPGFSTNRPQAAKSDHSNVKQNQGFRPLHPPFTQQSEAISALLNLGRRRAYARSAQAQRWLPTGKHLQPSVAARGLMKDCRTNDITSNGLKRPVFASCPQLWTTWGTTGALLCSVGLARPHQRKLDEPAPNSNGGGGRRGARSTT